MTYFSVSAQQLQGLIAHCLAPEGVLSAIIPVYLQRGQFNHVRTAIVAIVISSVSSAVSNFSSTALSRASVKHLPCLTQRGVLSAFPCAQELRMYIYAALIYLRIILL